MKKTLKAALLLCFFNIALVNATDHEVSIESLKLINKPKKLKRVSKGRFVSPSAEVHVTGINKTAKEVCVGGIAKLSNTSIQSSIFSVGIAKPNSRYKEVLRIWRPHGLAPKKTDLLYFKAWFCDEPETKIITSKTFKQTIDWEVSSELHSREEKTPYELFYSKMYGSEFEAVEQLFNQWNNPKEKNKDGNWKLSAFVTALRSSCDLSRKQYRKRCIERINYWKELSPNFGRLAEAKYKIEFAWYVIGGRYASNVDDFAEEVFAKNMRDAREILDSLSTIKEKNPVWYELYLSTFFNSKESDEKRITSFFNEAINKHPTYVPLYSVMVSYWANESENKKKGIRLNNLINKATVKTYQIDGDANYARLYSELVYSRRHSENIFDSTQVSWNKMKKSYETIISKYPSVKNLNMFTLLACQANDKSSYTSLRHKLGKKYKSEHWPDNYSLGLCDSRFHIKV